MTVAFETLAHQLLGRAEELCAQWLPTGRLVGREWCVGNIEGEKGQSLRINLDSGLWSDFANGQKGRDLIALYALQHNLSQLDAAKALGGDEVVMNGNVVALRPAVSDQAQDETFELPPADVPLTARSFSHSKHGIPSHVYVYRSTDRRPIMVVARYETADGKTFAPWTWREGRWRAKAAPKPRPLYGLERLESYSGGTIVVEGEKAADALQGATQRSSVVTWPGGAVNWRYADWSFLRGRACILWPDADPPGFAAMQGVAGILLQLDCRLHIIDTEGLPDGFDAADLVQQGNDTAAINGWMRPRLKPLMPVAPQPQRVFAPKTIFPAVTVDEDGERLPEAETEAPRRKTAEEVPIYSLAARYGLSHTKQGINSNLANARALMEGLISEGQWSALHYDDFLQKTMIYDPHPREWADHDTLRIADQMQRYYGMINIKKSSVEDAVTLYAHQHRRNSAQEWLRSLSHDGEPRLEQLFFRGFGAENNEYTRKSAKCFMIGLVARVLDPGCQVDTLPVLEGAQGIRKTSALRVLGGEYHAECQESAAGKDFYLVLAGKMLVEIAEFHAFKRTDIERLNGIITCRTDRYRAPYERRASDHKRTCVFVATTNKDDWNRDDTGARRFWPVTCTVVDIEWIKKHRDQLFAEAVYRFNEGESWWDVPANLATDEQNRRREEDVIARGLKYYCGVHAEIDISEVMQYMDLKGLNLYDRSIQNRITSMLRSWGYKSTFRKHGVTGARIWSHPDGIFNDAQETSF